MSWVERATELLHDTESIREEVRIGTGGVVVTNQRLLVFTPDQPGANFRQVDRPNVESVDRRTSGENRFLMPGVKAGIVGLVMVAFGYAFSLDQFAEDIALDGGTGAASAVGVGGLLGLVQRVIELLALLDELLRIAGGLALAVSAVALGVYVWSRESRLVVSVAGENDLELTAPDGIDDDLVDRLRTAIQGDGAAPAAGGVGESESDGSLGDKLDFDDGSAATDQAPSDGSTTTDQAPGDVVDTEPTPSAAGDTAASPDPLDVDETAAERPDSPDVDETAVENVLDAMDDDGEETTDDGTLDLTDPKDL